MAVVVEDGTGMANATSLVALAEARTYAASRGVTLSDDDEALEIDINKSMDYLKSREAEYSGVRTYPGVQALPWPRTGQVINGVLIAPNVVPYEAKVYQITVMMALGLGIILFPTVSGDTRPLKRSKIGQIEKEWFDPGLSSPNVTAINFAIEPLLGYGSRFGLTVVRK